MKMNFGPYFHESLQGPKPYLNVSEAFSCDVSFSRGALLLDDCFSEKTSCICKDYKCKLKKLHH
jgi:hypothetical protein